MSRDQRGDAEKMRVINELKSRYKDRDFTLRTISNALMLHFDEIGLGAYDHSAAADTFLVMLENRLRRHLEEQKNVGRFEKSEG